MAFNKKDQWTFEELVAETGKLISVHLMIIIIYDIYHFRRYQLI